MCEYRPPKADPNQTRITVGGNQIFYPGDVGLPTVSLELVKLVINSIFSRCNARFACFDVCKFYLATPLDCSEFVRIRIEDIPKDFILELNLMPSVHTGRIYFEIVKGCYGLPQAGMMDNNLPRKSLNKAGYYDPTTITGLWRHK